MSRKGLATYVIRVLDLTIQIPGLLKLAEPLVVWEFRKENVRILAELKRYAEAQPKQPDVKTDGTATQSEVIHNICRGGAYYTLHLPTAPDPPARSDVRTSLAVREFRPQVTCAMGRSCIVCRRNGSVSMTYHRSATNPRQLVTVAIADHLRANGNFADVTEYDGRLHADYVIT